MILLVHGLIIHGPLLSQTLLSRDDRCAPLSVSLSEHPWS